MDSEEEKTFEGKSTSFSCSQSRRHWRRNLSRRRCETGDLGGITFPVISHDRIENYLGRFYFHQNFTWPEQIKLLNRDFQSVARSAEGGDWGRKNRYLQENSISEPLSGPGKEVIGCYHKSINRIRTVGQQDQSQKYKGYDFGPPLNGIHIYVWKIYYVTLFPPPQIIRLTRYSNSLQ